MYDFLFAFSIMNAIRFGHNDRNQNRGLKVFVLTGVRTVCVTLLYS